MTTAAPCWRPRRSCATSGSAEHGANSACRSEPLRRLLSFRRSRLASEHQKQPAGAAGRKPHPFALRTGTGCAPPASSLASARPCRDVPAADLCLGRQEPDPRDRAGHRRRPATRSDMARRLCRPRGSASLVFQLGCGSFILRYGALRTSQAALAMLALGLLAASTGPLLLFALSAIIGGGGAAVSTPASSHLLGRYSPPRYAPLVFSIKQTAVPAGLVLAGLLGPLLTASSGWRGALQFAAASCFAFAVMLEPLRKEFDADRDPGRSLPVSRISDDAFLGHARPHLRPCRSPASSSTGCRRCSPPISWST